MTRLLIGSVCIQQGTKVLFSDYADGGAMWTGQGPREKRVRIAFATAYVDPPVVMVAMSMWDIDHKTNCRADLQAEKVTAKGFELVFRTWGDSRIARIRADWTALGAVRDDDDWDVE